MSGSRLARLGGSRLFTVAQMQLDPLHAARIGIENLVFDAAPGIGNDLATNRNTARDRSDETADRVDFLRDVIPREFETDGLRSIFKARARVDDEGPVGSGRDLRLVIEVVLIFDVADDHLDDVLDRNEPVSA